MAEDVGKASLSMGCVLPTDLSHELRGCLNILPRWQLASTRLGNMKDLYDRALDTHFLIPHWLPQPALFTVEGDNTACKCLKAGII